MASDWVGSPAPVNESAKRAERAKWTNIVGTEEEERRRRSDTRDGEKKRASYRNRILGCIEGGVFPHPRVELVSIARKAEDGRKEWVECPTTSTKAPC
jgi:hypothetical protein